MKGGQNDFPLHFFYGDIHANYDRVNRIFNFGRDRSWRKRAAKELLKSQPGRVLDLCTGTGDFLLELARQADQSGKGIMFTPVIFLRSLMQYRKKSICCSR